MLNISYLFDNKQVVLYYVPPYSNLRICGAVCWNERVLQHTVRSHASEIIVYNSSDVVGNYYKSFKDRFENHLNLRSSQDFIKYLKYCLEYTMTIYKHDGII